MEDTNLFVPVAGGQMQKSACPLCQAPPFPALLRGRSGGSLSHPGLRPSAVDLEPESPCGFELLGAEESLFLHCLVYWVAAKKLTVSYYNIGVHTKY